MSVWKIFQEVLGGGLLFLKHPVGRWGMKNRLNTLTIAHHKGIGRLIGRWNFGKVLVSG